MSYACSFSFPSMIDISLVGAFFADDLSSDSFCFTRKIKRYTKSLIWLTLIFLLGNMYRGCLFLKYVICSFTVLLPHNRRSFILWWYNFPVEGTKYSITIKIHELVNISKCFVRNRFQIILCKTVILTYHWRVIV